jgi:hypothetical protein
MLSQLRMFLTGDSFGDLLSALTGETVSTVACEVRCFGHGDYSLICDPQYKQHLRSTKHARITGGGGSSAATSAAAKPAKPAKAAQGKKAVDADVPETQVDDGIVGWIDVTLTVVDAEEWPENHGGYVSYLTYDEPLLTVPPKRNSVAIVYRTVGTPVPLPLLLSPAKSGTHACMRRSQLHVL